jgi:RHS repeat-associated protein
MKNARVTQWLLCALGLWLLSQQCGQCFYDPGLQRWINRDPLGEVGFEALRHKPPSALGDGLNRYLFVENAPIASVDSDGTLSVVIRRTVPRVLPKDALGGPYVPRSCRLTGKCTTNTAYGPNATICTYACVPGGYSDEIGSLPRAVIFVAAPGSHCPPEPPPGSYQDPPRI